MRAHEFITEDQMRSSEISLRHLNHLKHVGWARAASHARRDRLLEGQKAELAATRVEARAQSHETITGMADAIDRISAPSRSARRVRPSRGR